MTYCWIVSTFIIFKLLSVVITNNKSSLWFDNSSIQRLSQTGFQYLGNFLDSR